MTILGLNKALVQYTKDLRSTLNVKGNVSTSSESPQSTTDKLSEISNNLVWPLRKFEILESNHKLKCSTAEWSDFQAKIEELEKTIHVSLQDSGKAEPSGMMEALKRIAKVKKIVTENLMSLTRQVQSISDAVHHKLPKISKELTRPAGNDPHEEMQHKLYLLSELKSLQENIIALDPKEIEMRPELKAALEKIKTHQALVQSLFAADATYPQSPTSLGESPRSSRGYLA